MSNTPLVITSQPEIKLIPKIKTFLESVSRNGKGSERAYDAALSMFWSLLEGKIPSLSINKSELSHKKNNAVYIDLRFFHLIT